MPILPKHSCCVDLYSCPLGVLILGEELKYQNPTLKMSQKLFVPL